MVLPNSKPNFIAIVILDKNLLLMKIESSEYCSGRWLKLNPSYDYLKTSPRRRKI